MPSRRLSPDDMLAVHLAAICSRNRYTTDPQPVIDELLATAGDRGDILARESGRWSGFHESEHTMPLATAIREQIPGATDWVQLGRDRAATTPHSTDGFRRNKDAPHEGGASGLADVRQPGVVAPS